jgi:hypothetical protein
MTDDVAAEQQRLNPKRRDSRPERIEIEGDTLVRQDILVREQGGTERTINGADARGAPFCYVAGIKYRPIGAYRRYLAEQVQRKNQPPPRRRGQR